MKKGDEYAVTTGFERLDQEVARSEREGTHLWVLMTTYGLSDLEAAQALEGVSQLLDPSHLLSVTAIACYICEEMYEVAAGKPCVGNPE